MVSIIIAAYNEETVIGSCLDALRVQSTQSEIQIVVSANGCSDRTAQIAADREAVVIDRSEPGKAGALNAAEQVATSFPRVFLDADIQLPPRTLQSLEMVLESAPEVLAVVPRRRIDISGRPWVVKSYVRINEKLPAFRRGLFGRGVICLSERGRARFSVFPNMIADDLFLDSLFSDGEKAEAADVEVVVQAPLRTADLLARLVRVRRGNADMRAAAEQGDIAIAVRPSDRWAWLREVVRQDPRLIACAVPYVVMTLLSSALARRAGQQAWGRDNSTRLSADQLPEAGA